MLSLSANDYLQVAMSAKSSVAQLYPLPATATEPATPAVLVTMKQIAVDIGSFIGPTGPTGPTGPIALVPSGFTGSSTLSTDISHNSAVTPGSSGGTLLMSRTITITQTSYLWATSTITFSNAHQTETNMIGCYLIIDVTTSNPTFSNIDHRFANGVSAYISMTVHQRTHLQVVPGTYTASVYAYYTATATPHPVNTHVDLFILGHLM
jgi:hypothetical protein